MLDKKNIHVLYLKAKKVLFKNIIFVILLNITIQICTDLKFLKTGPNCRFLKQETDCAVRFPFCIFSLNGNLVLKTERKRHLYIEFMELDTFWRRLFRETFVEMETTTSLHTKILYFEHNKGFQ